MSDLVKRLRDVRDAYPEDIFPPLEGDPIKKTGDYYTLSNRVLIIRASAQMGRHFGGLLNEAADEIERMSRIIAFNVDPTGMEPDEIALVLACVEALGDE